MGKQLAPPAQEERCDELTGIYLEIKIVETSKSKLRVEGLVEKGDA